MPHGTERGGRFATALWMLTEPPEVAIPPGSFLRQLYVLKEAHRAFWGIDAISLCSWNYQETNIFPLGESWHRGETHNTYVILFACNYTSAHLYTHLHTHTESHPHLQRAVENTEHEGTCSIVAVPLVWGSRACGPQEPEPRVSDTCPPQVKILQP